MAGGHDEHDGAVRGTRDTSSRKAFLSRHHHDHRDDAECKLHPVQRNSRNRAHDGQ